MEKIKIFPLRQPTATSPCALATAIMLYDAKHGLLYNNLQALLKR